ncbi:translesion DNA synthesis-associated protein ImuA [Marinobacter changyiensis]|uniref:translesion DNA synthesis-associated protein ImuA n=1 Tax=Marinobacter changyiensis TaxID=2604091 RepID=UPI0012654FEC|nr:translesion DNA synthesis-associated protein ImuA [Marinobacter changyiensis]
MKELLDTLLQDARVWQAGHQARPPEPEESTGYEALDYCLRGVGWPRSALTECLLDNAGIGELQLLLPLIRRQLAADRMVFWINPPYTPYAPALERENLDLSRLVVVQTEKSADTLWTLENCLRSSVTGLVMAWPGPLKIRHIRRLQLAAEAGGGLCILFRHTRAGEESSPAALRLQLSPAPDRQLNVRILKRRGGLQGSDCTLSLPGRFPEQAPGSDRVIRGPWPDSNATAQTP